MIDRSVLLGIVEDFRKKIEPCWSEESAYKVPEIEKYGPFISGGQCAVTCLVLMDVLNGKFPEEHIFLVSGQVQSLNGEVVIRDHGWLRVDSGTNAVIVDSTIDQGTGIAEKVFIGTFLEIRAHGLHYIEKEIEADHGEREHPGRFKRYKILKSAFCK